MSLPCLGNLFGMYLIEQSQQVDEVVFVIKLDMFVVVAWNSGQEQ